MKYKTKSYVVSQMIKDYEKEPGRNNRLVFDCPIQRPEGLWNNIAQSLLIHSILQEYLVPAVFIVQYGADDFEPMTVLDGKQRMTTIYNYVNNGFKLNRTTPPVSVVVPEVDEYGKLVKDENGVTKTRTELVEVKNKCFKQLSKEFQDNIKNFELQATMITEATKTELEEQIYRLNNGKSPSATHKAFMKGGIDVAEAIRVGILGNNFFENRFFMSPAQKKGGEDMKCAFHVLTLLTDETFNRLTSGDLTKIAESMKNKWKEGKLSQSDIEYCNILLENLNRFLPDEEEFISKDIITTVHIPIMVMNLEKATQLIDDGVITEQQYRDFLTYWVTEGFYEEEYRECSEGSPSDKGNIERRIELMEQSLYQYLGIEDDILEEKQSFEIQIADEELEDFAQSFVSDEVAIQSLMLTTNSPYNNFEPETLNKMVDWYVKEGNKGMLYDCLGYKGVLSDAHIDINDKNQPLYLYAVKYINDCGFDINVVDWLNTVKDSIFVGIDSDPVNEFQLNSTIVSKQSEIEKNIKQYMNQGEY